MDSNLLLVATAHYSQYMPTHGHYSPLGEHVVTHGRVWSTWIRWGLGYSLFGGRLGNWWLGYSDDSSLLPGGAGMITRSVGAGLGPVGEL